jgi:N-methylhydantoinase B
MPTEALENEFPLLVDEYGLAPGSGGAGRQRGGLGIVRQVRALYDGTIFTGRSDNHRQGSSGTEGGADGGRGRMLRNAGQANEEVLSSKVAHVVLKAGESMRIETPGAGGFGPPAERSVEALAGDLRDEILTEQLATQQYGPALTQSAVQFNAQMREFARPTTKSD